VGQNIANHAIFFLKAAPKLGKPPQASAPKHETKNHRHTDDGNPAPFAELFKNVEDVERVPPQSRLVEAKGFRHFFLILFVYRRIPFLTQARKTNARHRLKKYNKRNTHRRHFLQMRQKNQTLTRDNNELA
jgi:hypothetical protein